MSHQGSLAAMKGEVCSQEFYLCRSILHEPEHAFQISFRDRSDCLGTKKAREMKCSVSWEPGNWHEIHTMCLHSACLRLISSCTSSGTNEFSTNFASPLQQTKHKCSVSEALVWLLSSYFELKKWNLTWPWSGLCLLKYCDKTVLCETKLSIVVLFHLSIIGYFQPWVFIV